MKLRLWNEWVVLHHRWNFFDVRLGHWKWLNVWLSVAKKKDEEIVYRTEYGRWLTVGVQVAWLSLTVVTLHTDKDWIRFEVHLRAARRPGS